MKIKPCIMKTRILENEVIEGIAMAIIVILMCVAFGRTNATGHNNLFWLLITVIINGLIIWRVAIEWEHVPAHIMQVALSLPFVILWWSQATLIENGEIPGTCCRYWLNSIIAFATCVFNIFVCIAGWEEDDKHVLSVIISLCSGVAILVMLYRFLNLI